MKSSFPKCVKRQFKIRCCNANAKFGDHVLEKSSSQLCTYIHTIYICEKLFTKTQSLNLSLALASSSSGMALNAFWKRALQI